MNWMILWYALGIFGLGLLYLVIALDLVPGLREERLGAGLHIPPEVFDWRPDGAPIPPRGLIRESRVVRQAAAFGRRRYVRQTRLRDPQTDDIVQVEPEQNVRPRDLAVSVSQ